MVAPRVPRRHDSARRGAWVRMTIDVRIWDRMIAVNAPRFNRMAHGVPSRLVVERRRMRDAARSCATLARARPRRRTPPDLLHGICCMRTLQFPSSIRTETPPAPTRDVSSRVFAPKEHHAAQRHATPRYIRISFKNESAVRANGRRCRVRRGCLGRVRLRAADGRHARDLHHVRRHARHLIRHHEQRCSRRHAGVDGRRIAELRDGRLHGHPRVHRAHRSGTAGAARVATRSIPTGRGVPPPPGSRAATPTVIGYVVAYGSSSVAGGGATELRLLGGQSAPRATLEVCDLPRGTHYFAVRAKNIGGMLSAYFDRAVGGHFVVSGLISHFDAREQSDGVHLAWRSTPRNACAGFACIEARRTTCNAC